MLLDYSRDPRVRRDEHGYTLSGDGDNPDWHVRKVGERWLAAPISGTDPGVWADSPELAIYGAIGDPQEDSHGH